MITGILGLGPDSMSMLQKRNGKSITECILTLPKRLVWDPL